MRQVVTKLRSSLGAHPRLRAAAYWATVLVRDTRGLFAASDARVGSLPREVNIEPSNLCNANCVFCGYQHQRRPHQPIELSLALRIVDEARAAGVERLGLTPIVGEPLVNRDLETIIRHARKPPRPLHVGVTTNGLLLTRKRYGSLVDAGISHIALSMSYPDADEYARVYRSPSFTTLLRNLNDVLEVYRPEHCRISVGIRSGRPHAESHALFERARQAGWSVEHNVFLDDWSGSVGSLVLGEGLAVRPLRTKLLPCTMLFTGPHFMSDGRATACGCRDLDGLSDLRLPPESLLRDMRAVYETGEVEALRERFRNDEIPEICVSCRHYNAQYEGETLLRRLQQLAADAVEGVRSPRKMRKLPLVLG